MRFADWQATPEGSRYLSDRLVKLIESAAHTLGARDATPCYVAWGEQPEARFQVMLSTDGGLAIFSVRANVPQEGPRLSGRLVRWARVQVGELTFEAHSGHVQVSAQFEGQVLLGLDAAGERIAEWMTEVYRRVDGAARGG
jgi:hypothetical protein